MMESKTILISRRMPLATRVSAVGEQVRGWLRGLDNPYNCEMDRLQLREARIRNSEYLYSYRIVRGRV